MATPVVYTIWTLAFDLCCKDTSLPLRYFKRKLIIKHLL